MTQATNRQPEYVSADCRRYEVEDSYDAQGNLTRFRVAEELIDGRWEGFVSIVEIIKAEEL